MYSFNLHRHECEVTDCDFRRDPDEYEIAYFDANTCEIRKIVRNKDTREFKVIQALFEAIEKASEDGTIIHVATVVSAPVGENTKLVTAVVGYKEAKV